MGWRSGLAGRVSEGVWMKTGMEEVVEPRSPETARAINSNPHLLTPKEEFYGNPLEIFKQGRDVA